MAHEELLARLDNHYQHAMSIQAHIGAQTYKDAAAALRGTLAELEAERKAREEERRLTDHTYELVLQRAEGAERNLILQRTGYTEMVDAAERKLAECEKEAQQLREGLNIAINLASCAHRGELEWNQIGNLRALAQGEKSWGSASK